MLSALMGGFGSAKTTTGVIRAVQYALKHPGSLGLIGAPTYPMLRDGTQREFFRWLPAQTIKNFNKGEHHLVLRSTRAAISVAASPTVPADGSEILFRSLDDPDSVRSLNLAFFHLDECQKAHRDAWLNLMARLRQPGFPQQGWGTGTHQGRDWTMGEFEDGGVAGQWPRSIVRDANGIRSILWHVSTRDNPFLPAHYVAMLESRYTGAWAIQGIDGGHAKFEGLVYPQFERGTHVIDTPIEALKATFKRVVYGVDWGYHYAPIIALGQTSDDQWIVAAEWYVSQTNVMDQIAAAKELVAKFGRGPFFTDPSRPDNAALFDRAGLTTKKFDQHKVDEGILYAQSLLVPRRDGKPGLLVHHKCVNFISEIETYIWAERPKALAVGAEWKDEPAKGQLDHAMDAWRYGLMGARGPQVVAASVAPSDSYTVPRGRGFRR